MADTRGFTLIEVIAAMAILLIVGLGLATMTGRFVRTVAEEDFTTAAEQLADGQAQAILMDPNYAGLDTAYVGVEGNFQTLPGVTRTTTMRQVGSRGGRLDYKVFTVVVQGPGIRDPISRTVTVAAP